MKKKLLPNQLYQPLGFVSKIGLLTFIGLLSLQISQAQQWNILGNESQVSSVSSSYTSIATVDTVPYVVYREGTVGKVKRKNTTTGNWEQVGDNIGTNVTYTRLYSNQNDSLYVVYVDAANGNKLAVETYNTATNTWEPLNGINTNLYASAGQVTNGVSQYSSTPRFSVAFDSNNQLFIAFGDGSNLTPYVRRFDGTTWVTVGGGAVNTANIAVGISLVLDESDVPWLVYCALTSTTATTGSLTLYNFNGTIWVPTTSSLSGIRHTSMALSSDNNLSIAYFNTGNTNRAAVTTYNKIAGTFGTTTVLSSRDAPNLSLIRDVSGNLYCSFIDYISSTAANVSRVFKQYTGTTTWGELKDPVVTRGIDEPTSTLTIAIGSDTASPYIVYLKTNSSSVTTPVIRKFIPPPAPAVLTSNGVSNITTTAANAGGNITSDGGATITERGVVYSPTNANPTTANTKVIATSGGIGSYTVTISGLTPAQFYYVRAYAINSGGTTYGNVVRLSTAAVPDAVVTAPKQMEPLNRGVVAVRSSATKVFVSWRFLGSDSANTAFNVYRNGVLLNSTPITTSTNYEDNTTVSETYVVKPIRGGVEGVASSAVPVWSDNVLSIPLQIPPGGTLPNDSTYTYTANDASVGDVDGDGEYEVFLKWEPTRKNDNAGGYSGKTIIDCYKLNGTRLWRIDLGININAGPHFTQFMVYDLDGDGKAEMACKIADGTKDGTGVVFGNPTVDYRTSAGWVQSGPEYLAVFNGLTGALMDTIVYEPARGNISDWGDSYGNRADRFVSAVAYLDGVRPSLVIGRGYYDKLVRAAYDFRGGQLSLRWIFSSETPGNEAYRGQGNHQMTIGDVDGDGKDEIINGASIINDNGTRLATYRNGHGDALHMSDMDPDRPGQEIWECQEAEGSYTPYGLRFSDAKTGELIFGVTTTGDIGRALAADIDPRYKGYEVWGPRGNVMTCKGVSITATKPSQNFAIWWDGDLSRELLDGTTIQKWEYMTSTRSNLLSPTGVLSNNSTKATPCLSADLFGDWREEVMWRTTNNDTLRIYTTNILTDKRIYTLMHDPQYRVAIAWQNSGYNQPPHPGYYLGTDMAPAPVPNIYLAAPPVILPVKLLSFDAKAENEKVKLNWITENETANESFTVERSTNSRDFTPIYTTKGAGNSSHANTYTAVDYSPVKGENYYRLKQTDFNSRSSYSAVRIVNFAGKENTQLTVFPNPVTNSVQLQLSSGVTTGNLQLSVTTVDGKRILQ